MSSMPHSGYHASDPQTLRCTSCVVLTDNCDHLGNPPSRFPSPLAPQHRSSNPATQLHPAPNQPSYSLLTTFVNIHSLVGISLAITRFNWQVGVSYYRSSKEHARETEQDFHGSLIGRPLQEALSREHFLCRRRFHRAGRGMPIPN